MLGSETLQAKRLPLLGVAAPNSASVELEIRLMSLAGGQGEPTMLHRPSDRVKNHQSIVAASGSELRSEAAATSRPIIQRQHASGVFVLGPQDCVTARNGAGAGVSRRNGRTGEGSDPKNAYSKAKRF